MEIQMSDVTATNTLLDPTVWSGKLFDGEWCDAPGTLDVTEPATGESLATAGMADGDSVAKAAAAAAAAQAEWASISYLERCQLLRNLSAAMASHQEELMSWLVRETGSIPAKAEAEVVDTIKRVDFAAAMPMHAIGELLPTEVEGRTSIARRVPRGVVGVLAPWNFPFLLAVRSFAPALATGNTVILKPDPNTPVTGGIALARLIEEAGFPPGVFHVLPGGADVGEALVADPRVSTIAFTGSSATGSRVGEACGRLLKKAILELGGNNAYLVLDDADLDLASSAGAWGSFLHSGQICLTAGRHLVHESIADQYREALAVRAGNLPVGDPNTAEVAMGPLINERQLERVESIVADTVAAGAEVVVGGKSEDLFYPATVLAGVKPEMRAFDEEIFGPVAPITTFSTLEEAIELTNSSNLGLSASIYSADPAKALAVGSKLRSGMVHVNDSTIQHEATAPFGGMGASGNGGRYGGEANFDEFTEWQWTTFREQPYEFPF
jgi:benzaldehyde dehydrogenase (NAD)